MGRFPLLRGLVDFVYPPLCAGCGMYTEEAGGICGNCIKAIDWWDKPIAMTDLDFRPEALDSDLQTDSFPLFAAASYADPMQQIIVKYKFRGAVSAAPLVAEKLAVRFSEQIRKLSPAVLLPIPLHPSREYLRGYNQAQIFADELAGALDLPVDKDLLVRLRKRRPQSRLRKSKRAANIRGVFALVEEPVDPDRCRRVILVDDVVTSGQTIFEARRTLIQGGFEVVGAIAMAHRL